MFLAGSLYNGLFMLLNCVYLIVSSFITELEDLTCLFIAVVMSVSIISLYKHSFSSITLNLACGIVII